MNDDAILNRVERISRSDVEPIISQSVGDDRIYVVEIDGTRIQSWHDYISVIQEEFRFPTLYDNMDGYNDWMRDLDWLNKDGFLLMIHNFSKFMTNMPNLRDKIIGGFSNTILPFWKEEIKHVVVGGEPKSFMVYLVD